MLLASCTKSTSTPTPTTSRTSTTSTTTKTTTPLTATTTIPTTTTATGNWWDSLGTPIYGGVLINTIGADITNFDPYDQTSTGINSAWLERVLCDDWTTDPSVFAYHSDFRPPADTVGLIAASWEFTDPTTYVLHLRQGAQAAHWQDVPPANGREFVASDVVWNYDREFGIGDGFTKPSPNAATSAFSECTLTATDNYTVVFKWTTSNAEFITEAMDGPNCAMENPEATQQWGNLNDWHHAVGTGPFILTDFVAGTSAILGRNPNYYGHDGRYPQNQLPYIDTLKVLIITDPGTNLAAIRTGKVDVDTGVSAQNVKEMQATNPSIKDLIIPSTGGNDIEVKNDAKPFNDINVREALQMAIDLPTIAETYYNGAVDPWPCSLTSNYMTGWGLPYTQWSADLQAQYAYNVPKAKALLTAAGYPNGFNTDIDVDSKCDTALLEIVKSYWAAINVNLNIKPIDDSSFPGTVIFGHTYDALAEWINPTLGLSYEPLVQLQRMQTGYFLDYLDVNDPTYNAFYTNAVAATTVAQIQQILQNCNEYVAEQHFCISLLTPVVYTLYQPWLEGYSGQASALGGSGGGPQYLGFYAARFWINQSLKNSTGQ